MIDIRGNGKRQEDGANITSFYYIFIYYMNDISPLNTGLLQSMI